LKFITKKQGQNKYQYPFILTTLIRKENSMTTNKKYEDMTPEEKRLAHELDLQAKIALIFMALILILAIKIVW